jgi:hypothetical protein
MEGQRESRTEGQRHGGKEGRGNYQVQERREKERSS